MPFSKAKIAQVVSLEGPPSTLEWVHWRLGPLKGGYSLSSPGFEKKVYIG